jgi:hypothetical protein
MAPATDSPLAGTWVHVFEQDTSAGSVFRPASADIPLSRRPRERLELNADGSGQIWLPGPDDRLVAQPAHWSRESDAVVLRTRDGDEYRIVDASAERLVVRIRRAR